jgi:hypothetical protein
MRAALLPTPGDPFLVAYWLRNFATWRDEVDELTVLVNGHSDPAVIADIRERVNALGGRVLTAPRMLGHGEALSVLVEDSRADYLLLCEDDAYIRRPGVVDERFRRLERDEVDIIGSPRGSASMELLRAATAKFGPDPETPSGETGPALWPCLVFAKRDILRATDRNYAAQLWPARTPVPGLGKFKVETSSDTFGATSYQLRSQGRRIGWESGFRATMFGPVKWWVERLDPPWFHVGSLSTGYGGIFGNGPVHIEPTDATGHQEWSRRLYWWVRFEQTADSLPEHRIAYRAGLQELHDTLGPPVDDLLGLWDAMYEPWITWTE